MLYCRFQKVTEVAGVLAALEEGKRAVSYCMSDELRTMESG